MKSLLLSVLFFFCYVLYVSGQQAACSSPIVTRKEIRELTNQERFNFVNAMNLANAGPRPTPYDNFVLRHIGTASQTHGTALFFPFHRTLTAHFEQFLRGFVPGVHVPYWDFTFDSADPASSPIFANSFCGGRGTGSTCRLIAGSFANRVCSYSTNPAYTVHYVRRCFNNGDRISPFYSYETIMNILQSATNYNAFRQGIENNPHGQVHWGVGGNSTADFTQMMSPCDPVFWPLHAYMDKLWDQWQRRNPNYFSNFGGRLADNSNANLNTMIPSYPYNVGGVLDITRRPFCYRYSDVSSLHDQTVNQLVNNQDSNVRRDLSDIDPDHVKNLKLRKKPWPLPDDFITHMKLNRTYVRAAEQKYSFFIDVCNTKIAALKKAVADSLQVSEGKQSIEDVVKENQGPLGDAVDVRKLAEKIKSKNGTAS